MRKPFSVHMRRDRINLLVEKCDRQVNLKNVDENLLEAPIITPKAFIKTSIKHADISNDHLKRNSEL